MARQTGANIFAGTLEPLAGGPLDARMTVPTKNDLTLSGNFPYPYVGMPVTVQSEGKLYILIDMDYTDISHWVESGGGGADNVIEGYFNPADELFYEESTYTTAITGAINTIYVALDTNFTYRYNSTTTKFVRLDEEDTIIQVTTLPAASATEEGNIYQYIGTTAGDLVNGYFYECVEDAGTPGTYVWVQKNTQPDADTKIQVEVLPAATSANEGQIVQYIGITSGSIVNGYFYECVEDSATPGTYVWVQKNIQPDNDTTIQVSSMPTVTAADSGRIVQYIGVTDTDYTNAYFYKCVEDQETPGTYIWQEVSVQAGGSGSGSLQKAITAAIEVGGIDVGDSFAIGTSYDDMWDALLNPTLYPTFTDPSASLSYSADTYYEVGSTIAAKTGTVSLNRGSISPAYGTSGYRSGTATNYALASSGADTEYSDSSTSSGTFSVSALTRSTKGNITLTATVSYAAGEQPKDSKGNDYGSPLAAGSKTATKTMQFILPYYYGKSASKTVSNFTGLTKSVTAKGQKQFKFTTNNEYMVMAYDSSYGNLSSILDPNGFETISGWTKSTLTVGGFSYYVYVANSATTDTNAQFTFKY